MHHRGGLKAGANHLGAALHLQRTVDHTAHGPNALPFRGQLWVEPRARRLGQIQQMHRGARLREPRQPNVFHGKDQHRRKPGGQTVEQQIQHAARGTAAQTVRRIAIERVFAHIEIDLRQLGGGKGEQLGKHALEIIARIARPHLGVQFRQTVQHPLLQLGHISRGNPLGLVEARQIAQDKAHGVAQPAIAVGHAFQDLFADAQINRVIRLRHPKPQNIRAIFLDHRFRCDGIADGFGHLHALFIQRKAMRQHAAIGRAPLGTTGLQHRRMEPTAVLIGALQIQIRNAVNAAILAVAQNKGMR